MSSPIHIPDDVFPTEILDLLVILEKADILKHHLLIGSYAFWVFKAIYSFDYFLITKDIDILLSKKDHSKMDINAFMLKNGFRIIPSQYGFVKYLKDNYEIEFLVERKGSKEEPVLFSNLNITAQPLPFLNILKERILEISLGENFLLFYVPAPEAFYIHKLLISKRRKGAHKSKSAKDLEQASMLRKYIEDEQLKELLDKVSLSKKSLNSIFLAERELFEYYPSKVIGIKRLKEII